MGSFDYDLFTIGAGSGGTRASRLAATKGARVGLAEESRIGGTCVVRGCIPKKFLVFGAEFAQAFRDAAGYGWTVGATKFDWATLRDNVARDVTRLSAIYERNLVNAGVEVFAERARIVGPNEVRLASGKTVSAQTILVAAGGRPRRPNELTGCELALVSDDAFVLDELPKRMVIVGGGYIAVEFANIFNALGVDVCLVYRGHTVLQGFDDDLRIQVHSDLERHGVRVSSNTMLTSIEEKSGGFSLRTTTGVQLTADKVLVAIGRDPNTEGIGLGEVGVKLDSTGAIEVDAYSRTNVPSIYAIGDVTDRLNLTPVAIREAHAFVETVFDKRPCAFDHADVPTAVFCSPPAAAVGFSEGQARKTFGAVDIYRTNFRPMRNVLAGNEDRTFMKLVVRGDTHEVVGVHMVGDVAAEIVQLAAIAVKAKLTKDQWDATCALHPTVAEELVLMREKYVPPELNTMG
ncbi:MAG: glutathione-disulfide reductase [Myxococcota bacterium]|nr:glutathione-disulfide reductase [Myxococcota bacterium]